MSGRQSKKLRRLVRRAAPEFYATLEQAILELPLKNRLRIAVQIVLKRKLH